MSDNQPDRLPRTTPDIVADQIANLKRIFPECVAGGKVDFERLRATLGDADALAGDDGYTFTWAGKLEAFRAIQTPSAASLAPAPEESVNWETTRHLFIEGENLEVLKLLYKSYFGKVKMIYIDPPYNTGNDFIYRDDYSEPRRAYLEKTGQMDAEGNVLRSNPETSGRYHSDWLSMIYPRLFLARQLLREDGMIFVSIDDNESHHLRVVLNEIFGEENFLASVAWEKRYTRSNNAKLFYSLKDTVLVYRRSPLLDYLREGRTEKSDSIYDNPDDDPRGPWASSSYVNPAPKEQRPNLVYPILNPFTNQLVRHPTHAWKYESSEHERHVAENRLWWGRDGTAKYPRLKNYLSEMADGLVPIDLWDYRSTGTTDEGGLQVKGLFGEAVFDNPKPTRLVQRMMSLATGPGEQGIVLDFFAGSCTTGHAVLEFNRLHNRDCRFILVQLPEPTPTNSIARNAGFETIAEIGKERIRRVIAQMQTERETQLPLESRDTPEDLGFKVFKLAPSTFRQWEPPEGEVGEALGEQLALFDRGLEESADPTDVIYEVILKLGYSLNASIEPLDLDGNRVYRVTDEEVPPPSEERVSSEPSSFYVCLDDRLRGDTIDRLQLDKETTFVCLDTAMDDSMKVNLAMQCLLKVI